MPGTIKLTTIDGTEIERAVDDVRRKPTPFDRTLAEQVVFHASPVCHYMNFRSQPGAVENAAHNALIDTIFDSGDPLTDWFCRLAIPPPTARNNQANDHRRNRFIARAGTRAETLLPKYRE